VNQNNRVPIPAGATLAFDLQLLQLCLAWIERAQAPQRVFSDNQWLLPNNPAPEATDSGGKPFFKPALMLPVGVYDGRQWQPAELLATTIGTRSSVESLFAQVTAEMNAAGTEGRDVVVSVQFNGMQPVSINNSNSYRLLFGAPQVTETPPEMVAFRTQFLAVIDHCKRTPLKLPAAMTGVNPAAFSAPGGSIPDVHLGSPAMQFQTATPPWLQAPVAPAAPVVADDEY
jgi:hypothetical protein